jgi:hypothetical protein
MNDFNSWLTLGLEKGWITEPFCNTHEGYQYLTDEQEKEFEEGSDPCVIVIQLKEFED